MLIPLSLSTTIKFLGLASLAVRASNFKPFEKEPSPTTTTTE